MREKLGGLWAHPDFLRLWAGQTISQFGSQITLLAIPLTAAVMLDATAFEMGVLSALDTLPFLLIGLFAGVWIDHRRRRPLLIMGDAGRALLLLAIPAADWLGVLHISVLFLVAPLVGVLSVFFEIAYQSYLPALVQREHLVEGNTKLETSRSTAQIAGPGIAGVLIQLVTAPIAIVIDAASFLGSALFLLRIKQSEPEPEARAADQTIWREIGEGLHFVFGDAMLRGIAGCTATMNFFSSLSYAVYILFVTRPLGLSAGMLGAIFAIGNVGLLIGALASGSLARRLGVGPTIIGGAAVSGAGGLLIPFAGGGEWLAVSMLIVAQCLMSLGGMVYNINQVSLRQAITPDRVQGRMNATMRFIVWGIIPLGALAGGALGGIIGLRPTLLVGAIGGLGGFAWVLFTPLRRLAHHPSPAKETVASVS